MYTLIYGMYTRQYMAGKLYWRVKKNGKWTWTPAIVVDVVYNESYQKMVKHVLGCDYEH